jgi:hypothetical protein
LKTVEPEKKSVSTSETETQPFFSKERERTFFDRSRIDRLSFFNGPNDVARATKNAIQRKCTGREKDENPIQRQEQQEPPEQKPESPDTRDELAPLPVGRKPRVTKCSSDPRFPDFGCFGQQLKLDIDENLINNAHQFSRVASLFPGDDQLMFDTLLRYGLGPNILETSFGFAGASKGWSKVLTYGAGGALKTYDILANGELKLDVQLPLGKGFKLDINLDIDTNPSEPGEERFNTSIGVSRSF